MHTYIHTHKHVLMHICTFNGYTDINISTCSFNEVIIFALFVSDLWRMNEAVHVVLGMCLQD